MLFNWDKDTIRRYLDAADYTGFFRNASVLIAPLLRGYDTLCDIGCGLGLIDLELSSHIKSIKCIDICPNAIAVLRRNIAARGVENISTQLVDYSQTSEVWDIIHLCFFSSRDIDPFLHRCRKMIVVVSGDNNEELFPEKYRTERKNSITKEIEYLRRLGLEYKLSKDSLEFGQPLRSMDEARAYVRTYAKEIPDAELDEFLKNRIVETGEMEFPLYIPRRKDIGVFEISGMLGK